VSAPLSVLHAPRGAVLPAHEPAAEAELVDAARRDPREFGRLYRLHAPAIQRFLRRRLGDPHTAEDALAETFVSALQGLPRYRSRGLPFRAWLYRLAVGAVSRSRRRRALLCLAVPEETAAPEEEERREADLLRAALLRLPPRFEAVLSLHYLEGLPVDEVAQVLGCATGTVKSRLSRGRSALRREWERRGGRA
jgi:RNA polymerase sigma-70 factor (ECF subfamily)